MSRSLPVFTGGATCICTKPHLVHRRWLCQQPSQKNGRYLLGKFRHRPATTAVEGLRPYKDADDNLTYDGRLNPDELTAVDAGPDYPLHGPMQLAALLGPACKRGVSDYVFSVQSAEVIGRRSQMRDVMNQISVEADGCRTLP